MYTDSKKLTLILILSWACNSNLRHNMFNNKLNKKNNLINNDKIRFSCATCDKKFTSKKDLEIHSLSHLQSKSFSCDKCHKKFEQKESLTNHCTSGNCKARKDKEQFKKQQFNISINSEIDNNQKQEIDNDKKSKMRIEKNQEVELRAKLNLNQKNTILEKISKTADFINKKTIEDIYYCKKEANSLEDVSMKEIGSFSLRLRNSFIDNDRNVSNTLNIKVINKFDDHNSWKELETKIGAISEMHQILDILGYKRFFSLKKTRYIYKHKDQPITYNIEDIVDFGETIEIEKITTLEDSEEAKQEIKSLFKEIGIEENQIVKKSITHMIMNERSKF